MWKPRIHEDMGIQEVRRDRYREFCDICPKWEREHDGNNPASRYCWQGCKCWGVDIRESWRVLPGTCRAWELPFSFWQFFQQRWKVINILICIFCLWIPGVYSLSYIWLFATPWAVALHGPWSVRILQARILEWVDMPSSEGSSQLWDQTLVSHTAGRFFNIWATRDAQEHWSG